MNRLLWVLPLLLTACQPHNSLFERACGLAVERGYPEWKVESVRLGTRFQREGKTTARGQVDVEVAPSVTRTRNVECVDVNGSTRAVVGAQSVQRRDVK